MVQCWVVAPFSYHESACLQMLVIHYTWSNYTWSKVFYHFSLIFIFMYRNWKLPETDHFIPLVQNCPQGLAVVFQGSSGKGLSQLIQGMPGIETVTFFMQKCAWSPSYSLSPKQLLSKHLLYFLFVLLKSITGQSKHALRLVQVPCANLGVW